MSRSGGMSQLFKGIIIGVVLIMAIIGTMSLLGISSPFAPKQTQVQAPAAPTSASTTTDISSPSITLNPEAGSNPSKKNTNNNKIGDLNAALSNEKDLVEPQIEESSQNTQAPISYGMMALNSINPKNNSPINTNFVVFDRDNKKIAQSNNANKTAYRLPVGQYKVEATLTRVDEATQQLIPVSTKSRYIIVRTNSTSKQTFEIEPPATTGILQVSAKLNDQLVRANFVIQNNTGEVIASRNNVSNSLFKLNTGIYKVTVTNGSNRDFRSVEVKAGDSTQTVFFLQNAIQQGRLLLRVFDKNSSNAIRADINISRNDGTVIQNISSATKTELSLAPGSYKITIVGPNENTISKNITIGSGQTLNEVVRFSVPSNTNTQVTENTTNTTNTIPNENIQREPTKGTIKLVAIDEQSKKPLRSNFYIQTLAGKHLDKKIYTDNATFNLAPGIYKITVRSKNRKNQVKNITVASGSQLSETFVLVNPPNPTANNNSSVSNNTASSVIPSGFLNVVMQGPANQNRKSHFIVKTQNGKKIVELTSVDKANFKLDTGSYIVTAINNNKRKEQRVTVRTNQNARLVFNTSQFANAVGILRSRIIDETGRPLKGNLIVRNMAGKIVARADNVATASFNLPPVQHVIIVQIQGLSGEEVIRIREDETTIQTFTIAAGQAPQQRKQEPNSPKDIKEFLKDKLRKELQRNLN